MDKKEFVDYIADYNTQLMGFAYCLCPDRAKSIKALELSVHFQLTHHRDFILELKKLNKELIYENIISALFRSIYSHLKDEEATLEVEDSKYFPFFQLNALERAVNFFHLKLELDFLEVSNILEIPYEEIVENYYTGLEKLKEFTGCSHARTTTGS